jgi:hypothetical protein
MLDLTPLLRLRAKARLNELARQHPAMAQRRVLADLLHRARDTKFGRAHGFGGLRSVTAYQAQIPLRRYEAFWTEYWQPAFPNLRGATWPGRIPFLALSSGTSGGPTKYLPVSDATLRANRDAALDALIFHSAQRPDSRLLAGRNLLLGGSTSLERLAPHVHAGDLSGIAAARIPLWARTRSYPPRDIALLGDWPRKIDTIARLCLNQPITSISGTPSWLLLFFEHMAALRPTLDRRLAVHFPQLELIIHGGLGMAPYRDRFAQWLEGSRIQTREVYAASEGFIAVADQSPGDGMRLLADRALFHEFVPLAELDSSTPTRHWLGTAQPGVDYAVVVTTASGLWSYVLGDTVMFDRLDPPRLRVTGRTGWSLSIVGEHVTGGELDKAVAIAARESGVLVQDYAAAPLPPDASDPRGGHLLLIEFASSPPIDRFARAFDTALAAGNADYAAHRAGDYGMRPPQMRIVPPGGFEAWMAARGKLGGQHKVPRVINDTALLGSLLQMIGQV